MGAAMDGCRGTTGTLFLARCANASRKNLALSHAGISEWGHALSAIITSLFIRFASSSAAPFRVGKPTNGNSRLQMRCPFPLEPTVSGIENPDGSTAQKSRYVLNGLAVSQMKVFFSYITEMRSKQCVG